MTSNLVVGVLVVAALIGVRAVSFAQSISLFTSVMSGGGGRMSDSTLQISGTVGQPAVGFGQDPERLHGGGFWYQSVEFVTDVPSPREGLPRESSLWQNYPNPFNPSTTIRYGLPGSSRVTLAIFNPLGQLVTTLVSGEVEAGYHDVRFDAARLSSGVYLYRLTAGDFVQTRKLLYLK